MEGSNKRYFHLSTDISQLQTMTSTSPSSAGDSTVEAADVILCCIPDNSLAEARLSHRLPTIPQLAGPLKFEKKMASLTCGSSKRAKEPNSGAQTVSCLVDGCNSDLSNCKAYHRRHKVCELHSKALQVTIAGQTQRFCQQCSRFHSVEEFDVGMRTCRKRVAYLYNRRRQMQQTGLLPRSGSLFSDQQGPQFSSWEVLSSSAAASKIACQRQISPRSVSDCRSRPVPLSQALITEHGVDGQPHYPVEGVNASEENEGTRKSADNDEYVARSISFSTLSRMLGDDDNDEEVKKIFLKVIHKFLNSSNFCCLNCNTYISDVLTRQAQELESMSTARKQSMTSTSIKDQEEDQKLKGVEVARSMKLLDTRHGEEPEQHFKMLCLLLSYRDFYCPECNACISKLITEKLKSWSITLKEEEHGQISPRNIGSSLFPLRTFYSQQNSTNQDVEAIRIPSQQIREPPKQSSRGKRWELVLECIVSDGLFASITSLIVVTSAAATNISNGSAVTFASTNLIAGLFIIRHNLGRILKKHEFKKGLGGIDVEQVTDQYIEIIRDRLLYLLYFMMGFLSFLFFGGVPPLIYGFTFQETDDKNLKLAVAAGASLLCITVLAILKAHIQKHQNWLAYAKTMVFYVCIGFVAFGISYIAGDFFGKLLEKLGLLGLSNYMD